MHFIEGGAQLPERGEPASTTNRLAAIALTVLFLLVVLRTAWISDDAAITLRTVLNFVNGFGPTFNIDERVQAYTHPLWFFTLSLLSLILGNVFHATFFLSITLSAFVLGLLLLNSNRDYFTLVMIGSASILSKAFVDFSTSGLENPLSHFLLFLAVMSASAHIQKGGNRLTVFFLICSGLYLTRPDLIILVLPVVGYLAFSAKNQMIRLVASASLAAVPVVMWTVFSLFYYGFLFPNTAYAKLGAGIALEDSIIQGIRYLLHSIDKDPVTVFVITAGVTGGLLGSSLSKSLSIGIIVYLVYIIYIGGDFMEGRFLTAPFFMSLIVLSREIPNRKMSFSLIVAVAILGSATIYPNIISGSSYSNTKINNNGIADERGFYFQKFGLLTATGGTFSPPQQWNPSNRKVDVICGLLGFNAIKEGPGMHYIDSCGLADPLLARLPARENPDWRIGHFHRQLPTGYKESIEQGRNILSDPKTAAYWESIRTVTRGSLFEKDRFAEIARLNLGLIQRPDWEMYRLENIPQSLTMPTITEQDVKIIRLEGTPWNAPGNIVFEHALDISLANSKNIASIDISLDNNDTYEIIGLRGQEYLLLTTIYPKNTNGLARHKIKLEELASDIEKIRVKASSGDGMYSIGHFLVNAE